MYENSEKKDMILQKDPTVSLVVMMCGLAGSGKTTFTQQLEKDG